jgi:MFS family permease
MGNGLPHWVYNNFSFELFNAIFWQSFGSPLLLFIRQSGASAVLIGLTSALPLLLMPVTLSMARQVEKLGYRRTALLFWTGRWLFSSSMILIALVNLPLPEGWRVAAAFIVLILYHFNRNLGMSGWMPWLTTIIPLERRGLFLSRTTLFSNFGSIGAYLIIGMILGSHPALSTFAWVFAFGTVGGIMSTLFMLRVKAPTASQVRNNQAETRLGLRKSLGFCFAQRGFKNFLIVQTFYGVAFFGIPSLSLIYLREKVGLGPDLILLFSTAGVIGAALTSVLWGGWIDRRQDVDSLQLLAFGGLCLNSVLWLLLQAVPTGLTYVLAAVLLFGNSIWIGALNMSQSHSIMSLAPVERRVLFQNVATFLTYCSQALAPVLWGLMLDWLDHQHFELNLGFYKLAAYQVFFLATLLVGLLGVAYIYRQIITAPPEDAEDEEYC